MAVPIPTVTVNSQLFFSNGDPAEGIKIKAFLKSPSQNPDGYVVPLPDGVETLVDANGDFSLELWPNTDSTLDSYYHIQAYSCDLEEFLNVIAVVPESAVPLNLEDIALPISTISLAGASGNVPSIRKVLAGEGLAGGGDLSMDRTFDLDLTTITTERLASEVTLSDIIAIQDPNVPGAVRYIPLSSLPGIGFPEEERSYASVGQTEIPVVTPFTPNNGQIQLAINGRDVYSGDYSETTGLLTLSEPLEGGEEILVRVLKSASLVAESGVQASDIAYIGGSATNVEEALDELYSLSSSTPFVTLNSNTLLNDGDRVFADPTSGSIVLTLPASPIPGVSRVTVIEASQASNIIGSGPSVINNVTIARNGQLIMDVADDLILDQAHVSIDLYFMSSVRGWRFSE